MTRTGWIILIAVLLFAIALFVFNSVLTHSGTDSTAFVVALR